MLREIKCEHFNQKRVTFHEGLNVVVGDENATNSIGKSTLLMLIDYVMGGDTFLKHNRDVVDEFGDHDYFFCFSFDNDFIYFRRGTQTPELVYICNEQYEELNESEPLTIEDYRTLLKSKYNLSNIGLSFRQIISTFSRVWGKENLDVKHALHGYKSQTPSQCVNALIKLFDKYEPLEHLSNEVKRITDERSALDKAFKQGFINKNNALEYKNNLQELTRIDKEIEDIKDNLAKYTMNISEIANKEIMELKVEKDRLLDTKLGLSSRLERVRNDLDGSKVIKSKQLSPLLKFFPDVDVMKLNEIEAFHSKMTKILKKELRISESEITNSLENIEAQLEIIDKKIEKVTKKVDNPQLIIDRVYDLSQSHSKASTEIQFYEAKRNWDDELKELKRRLSEKKKDLVGYLSKVINDKISHYVRKVYSEKRKSPKLKLNENSYSFEIVEDTGTGKAYSNLVLLDLAILELTDLPVIIHDSLLFKNIETPAVAKLIALYLAKNKQTFISIDEIHKYGKHAVELLVLNQVIKLSDDQLLYTKDWRK